MPNDIVDNIEPCVQQNIVQCCFHQPQTGCSFLAVYTVIHAKDLFGSKSKSVQQFECITQEKLS